MTETTQKIFESYQVRKSRNEKRKFAEYLKQLADNWGYSFKTESGIFGAKNLIVGNPSTAKVIYTAHYDTAPVLPFPNFITPKNFLIYILYNIVLAAAICVVLFSSVFALTALSALLNNKLLLRPELLCFFILFLLIAGPANKHTANDNTSGVTLLIDIMRELPEDRRNEVCFVFFDLEEMGVFGSASFALKHKKELKNRLLINFDCVSDGDNMLFVLRKKARNYRNTIAEAFAPKDNFKVEVAEKGVFFPSDQVNFPCGVGVGALRSTKGGLLYMNRIHTSRDTVYKEENIIFLKNGAIKLTELM